MMKRLILAFALVAFAVPQCALAGPRCHKLGQRFAAKRAASQPVCVMPAIGRAVIVAPAKVLRAVLPATCANGVCK